jgi:hypothetical protein
MAEEKRKRIFLLPLRLSAAIFGLLTLLECCVLGSNLLFPALFRIKAAFSGAEPLTIIGGTDVNTVIYVTSDSFWSILLPFLAVLPPLLTVASLFLLRRHKRLTSVVKTKE